jgi:hypothetical protein
MTDGERRQSAKGSVPQVGPAQARPAAERMDAARPWGAPPSQQSKLPEQATTAQPARRWRGSTLASIAFAALLLAGVLIPAYQDLSSPGAWTYWKEFFGSPSMTSSVVTMADGRKALAIDGRIGPASASWFRERLDAAGLNSGDLVFLSSPGGSLDQGLIMGAVVRARGLTTVVGRIDSSGRSQPARCASACVFVFAGGKVREAMPRSMLGVHQFSSTGAKGEESAGDLVSRTQRTTGIILDYMTKMGVSPSIMQAMTASKDIRWLTEKEAFEMNLVTARYAGS